MNDQGDPKTAASAGNTVPAGKDEESKPVDYLREVYAFLGSGKVKDAYQILMQATVRFPEEPLILSYYGSLQAVVDKKFRSGVDTCNRAIRLVEERGSGREKTYYPVLYLNLGKAFIAAERREDALDAFRKGIKYDSGNKDLKKELQTLGVRRKPVVPFLGRTNPINVLLGMVLRSSKNAPREKKSGGRGSSR